MIEFTQYLRPDGKTRQVWIEVPRKIQAKSDALINAGYHFNVEELSTGMVSMTCEQRSTENLISIRVCPNDKHVPENVWDLIKDSYSKIFSQIGAFQYDEEEI